MSIFLFALAQVTQPAAEPAAQPSSPPVAAPRISDDGFKEGADTIATVTAKLGRPNSNEANSDGTTTIRYARVRTSIKGASFIPIIGMFAGGATGKTTTKAFTFGSDGLLKSFSSGNFQTDCSTFGGCK